MSADQPTPTRLGRERLERIALLLHGNTMSFESRSGQRLVGQLAVDALAYRTALEQIADLEHDNNLYPAQNARRAWTIAREVLS